MKRQWLSSFQTPVGSGGVAASRRGVTQVWLPGAPELDMLFKKLESSAISGQASRQLEQYFNKELKQFDVAIDLTGLSNFQQCIAQLLLQIPYGTTRTYGELAVLAGAPNAARAVGRAVAANPLPIIIPCHRVLAASGALTGYSAAGGISMKRFLLLLEAADFRGKRIT